MSRAPSPLLEAVASAAEELSRRDCRFEVFARLGSSHHVRARRATGLERRYSIEVGVACRIATAGQAGFSAAAGSGSRAGREAARAAVATLTDSPDPLPPREALGSVALPPPPRPCSGDEVHGVARTIVLAAATSISPVELVELRVEEATASSLLVTGEGFNGQSEAAGAVIEMLLAPPCGPLRLFRRALRSLRELDAERFVGESAASASRLARGGPVSRQLADVLLTPAAAAPLLIALSESLQHPSPLVSSRPQARLRISPAWRLLDDRLGSHGLLPQPFDGEGIPSRRLVVLDQGRIVETWGTWQNHRSTGAAPGGAVRHSYREPPEAGPANLVVPPAELVSQAELLSVLGDGYLIDMPAGRAVVDPRDGRFSLSAAAQEVSGGRLVSTHPVVELRGSFRRLLLGLEAAGSERASFPLSVAVTTPHLLFRHLEVG